MISYTYINNQSLLDFRANRVKSANAVNKSEVDIKFATAYIAASYGLKWVEKGVEHYVLNGKSVSLYSGDFLWVNAGDKIELENREFSQGVCINFKHPPSGDKSIIPSGKLSKLFGTNVNHLLFVDMSHTLLWEKAKQAMHTVDQQINSNLYAPIPHSEAARREVVVRVFLAVDYLHDLGGKNISLQELASAVAMSPYYFNRCFKLLVGMSPKQYLLHLRLETAKQLIREGREVAEVAILTDFTDGAALSNAFKKKFHYRPSELFL